MNTKNRKGAAQATKRSVERAFLVAVDGPKTEADWTSEGSLAELNQLATTAGVEVVGQASQRLRQPSSATYIGKGKVEEIALLKAELDFDLVIFDDELTPSQQRNLERELKARVIDRNALILHIFGQRAQTREGRLQVELARLEYELPRLAGQWTHLERQAGATNTRGGPGETQLEVDRRKARHRISETRAEIEKVRQHRAHYRQRRQEAGVPVIAIVGYTNSGKSTLLNTMTRADVLSEDKLFATLDPTTRRLVLPSGQRVLLTDTVGFIQKLPPMLAAAFRATLEELESADVLLHVVDVTHPKGYEQGQTVLKILADLGLADRPIVTALNKVDLLTGEKGESGASAEGGVPASIEELPSFARQMLGQLSELYPSAVPVSAGRGWGLGDLSKMIESTLARESVLVSVFIPFAKDEEIQTFRNLARVIDQSYTDDGVTMTGQMPRRYVGQFRDFIVNP